MPEGSFNSPTDPSAPGNSIDVGASGFSNSTMQPAPGTIPRSTIKIGEALEAVEAEEKASSRNDAVRTFQSDVAGRVKNDNVSMIKIALAEKARQERNPTYEDVASAERKNPGAAIAIIGAFILVGGIVTGLYFFFNKPIPPTISEQIAPDEPELIYSENQIAVSARDKSSDFINKELSDSMLQDLDLGVIRRTLLTTVGAASSTRNTTAQEFFDLTRSRPNDSLKTALGTNYFLGSYSGNPHDTFMLFTVNSYESAYPGMLAWEPFMETDIGRFFPYSRMATANATETGSTSISVRSVGQPLEFRDRVLQNKDTRVLIGDDGNIKFLYTFLDTKTLLIVSSERGLKEVQSRLTTGRIRR